MTTSTLIRQVRLVPVRSPGTDRPVDLRITDGVVVDVAPGLSPAPSEDVVDGGGRWAVPGLWDQHVHMGQWAQTSRRLDVSGADRAEDVTRLVAAHVAALGPDDGATVQGYGYRLGTWPRLPTVAELDAVSGAHPVVLVSGDAHNGWLNTAALRLLGVSGVTGPVEENDWFTLFGRLNDLPGMAAQAEAGYRRAVADAARKGVVGVVDLEFAGGPLEWPERVAAGIDALRIRTGVYPDGLDAVLQAGLRSHQPVPGGRGLVTMGPLKLIFDGSLNTRTALCHTPYAGAGLEDHPRGRRNYTRADLVRLLTRARDHGLETAVHAIGDAAVADALDGFAATGATGSIEHAQLVDLGDLPRMARLGVRASVQPAHLLDDREVTLLCWPDRADRCFAFASMLRAGVSLALGSDAPVSPLDPWLAMAAAVHRTAGDQPAWNPAEALTPQQALAASTDGADTLAPGSRGDVVLLDDDPLRGDGGPAEAAARLRRMRVAATFVAGRATHRSL
jgi:predicted amidohydrolase YtcJ